MSAQVDFNFLMNQYNLLTDEHPSAVLSAPLSDVLDEAKAEALIRSVMHIIRAGKPDIAAYHLSSWLGMVCSAVQASLSLYDTVLRLTPERTFLHIAMIEGRRKVMFLLREKEQACLNLGQEEMSRAAALNDFYTKTISPILRGIAQATGVKEPQLWAQFVTRLYNERDYCLNTVQSEERQRIILEDFAIVTDRLKLDQLGLTRNPFQVEFRWIEHLQHPNELTRQKIACCLAYQTDTSHGYCYTCPRLNEEGRKQKRELYV
ncbi:hypothetical protein PAESOLCIP111_03804 [Paenibacillus solanacearum]|uniref:Uncharacterized protein n=1 Tax=Paenibacillus solanacearum TaxID=2048548 RepID=A0A916K618_9BACL|nr:(2Fe-2S)-binding protein [Paenibacillus solanacearum]CAG7636990.1 hypothetical protein PAESOLCIP111_03804 [Paenibacillus solanacearum]